MEPALTAMLLGVAVVLNPGVERVAIGIRGAIAGHVFGYGTNQQED